MHTANLPAKRTPTGRLTERPMNTGFNTGLWGAPASSDGQQPGGNKTAPRHLSLIQILSPTLTRFASFLLALFARRLRLGCLGHAATANFEWTASRRRPRPRRLGRPSDRSCTVTGPAVNFAVAVAAQAASSVHRRAAAAGGRSCPFAIKGAAAAVAGPRSAWFCRAAFARDFRAGADEQQQSPKLAREWRCCC